MALSLSSLASLLLSLSAANAAVPKRLDRFGDPLPAGAVARIGTVRWWCGRVHGPLIYAPDGKSLFFRDGSGIVHIMDAATGKELRRIIAPGDGRVACFALSPNGRMAVTAGELSSVIRLWDAQTGKELRRIEGDPRGIYAVAFSPDGQLFAAGMNPGIRLWDCRTWREIRRFAGTGAGYVNGIFFLPDGKKLISGDRLRITWWDAATGREMRRIDRQKDGFHALAISPDGKRLAAVQSPNQLCLWDVGSGKEIHRINLDRDVGSCLCFSPDSQTLACGNGIGFGGNQTLFFAADTGKELRRWHEGDNYTMRMAYSPDGKTLAQARSHILCLRDSKTGKSVAPDSGLPDSVLSVRFHGDGRELIAGCRGGRTGKWNPLTGEPLSPLRDPPDSFGRRTNMLLGPALTNHGEKAALVDAAGVLHIWERTTGKVYCRISEPLVGEDQADFSADGKSIAVKHRDNIIRIWDAKSGKLRCSLAQKGQYFFPHPHAFSPDGRTLATAPVAHGTGVIHLYTTTTGKEEGRIVWSDSTTPTCLLFSQDGRYLLAAHQRNRPGGGIPTARGDEEDALRLWDRQSGREVRRWPTPGGDIRALAISPDGKTVAAAIYHTIFLWELAGGAERGRFTGHREWIWSLAFSPDGRLLASGSRDYTACVWDVAGVFPDGKWRLHSATSDQLERWWNDLGGSDGLRAYRAVWRFAAGGPSAVAFLAKHLRPTSRVEADRLAHLIADLDSDRFETRDRATAELQRLDEQAESELRRALEKKPSLEASRRLRALLDRLEKRTLSGEQMRELRAVEALEHAGIAEAQALLRSLAQGAPKARLTREADAARQRSSARHAPNSSSDLPKKASGSAADKEVP